MIDKKYLESFISREKTELMKKLENSENSFDKSIVLNDYYNNIDDIISYYEKLKTFSSNVLLSIIDEDEEFKRAAAIQNVIKNGLYIYWNREDKKFIIDFEKSTDLLKDEDYLNTIENFLELAKTKLSKKIRAYELKIDKYQIKDWGNF